MHASVWVKRVYGWKPGYEWKPRCGCVLFRDVTLPNLVPLVPCRSCTPPYLMLRWHSGSIAWQDRSRSASWNWATSSEVTSCLQLIRSKYLESLQEGFCCFKKCKRIYAGTYMCSVKMSSQTFRFFHHANSGKLLLIKWKNYGIVVSFLFIDTKKLDTAAVMSLVGLCSSGLMLSFVFLKSKKVDLWNYWMRTVKEEMKSQYYEKHLIPSKYLYLYVLVGYFVLLP